MRNGPANGGSNLVYAFLNELPYAGSTNKISVLKIFVSDESKPSPMIFNCLSRYARYSLFVSFLSRVGDQQEEEAPQPAGRDTTSATGYPFSELPSIYNRFDIFFYEMFSLRFSDFIIGVPIELK